MENSLVSQIEEARQIVKTHKENNRQGHLVRNTPLLIDEGHFISLLNDGATNLTPNYFDEQTQEHRYSAVYQGCLILTDSKEEISEV